MDDVQVTRRGKRVGEITVIPVPCSEKTEYQFRVWDDDRGFVAYGKRYTMEAARAAMNRAMRS